jgi:hypothetical protein
MAIPELLSLVADGDRMDRNIIVSLDSVDEHVSPIYLIL